MKCVGQVIVFSREAEGLENAESSNVKDEKIGPGVSRYMIVKSL